MQHQKFFFAKIEKIEIIFKKMIIKIKKIELKKNLKSIKKDLNKI